jgi:hypothetical protein
MNIHLCPDQKAMNEEEIRFPLPAFRLAGCRMPTAQSDAEDNDMEHIA